MDQKADPKGRSIGNRLRHPTAFRSKMPRYAHPTSFGAVSRSLWFLQQNRTRAGEPTPARGGTDTGSAAREIR